MNTLKLHLIYNMTAKLLVCTVYSQLPVSFKGIVHPNIKIMSLLTPPEVVCSAEHKRRYFEEYGYPNS